MEIVIPVEKAYMLLPQIQQEPARLQVEAKKAQWVAGTVGALISRPKPEEIQQISMESRLEPFWHVTVGTKVVYDRKRTYTTNATGNDVFSVTIGGVTVDTKVKDRDAQFTIEGVEHCHQLAEATRSFSALTGERMDMTKHLAVAKNDIPDLAKFSPHAALVVPPKVQAMGVIRQVLKEIVKPVKSATAILSERVEVKILELNFRPIYAFEFEWAAKGKRVVVEFDALTGEINGNGKKVGGDQFKGFGESINAAQLYEITADAVGPFARELLFGAVEVMIPGGSTAVKIVRTAMERTAK